MKARIKSAGFQRTRVVIEIMVLAYLVLVLFFPAYRPRKSVIAYAVGAFLFAFLLSTLIGIAKLSTARSQHRFASHSTTWLDFARLCCASHG